MHYGEKFEATLLIVARSPIEDHRLEIRAIDPTGRGYNLLRDMGDHYPAIDAGFQVGQVWHGFLHRNPEEDLELPHEEDVLVLEAHYQRTIKDYHRVVQVYQAPIEAVPTSLFGGVLQLSYDYHAFIDSTRTLPVQSFCLWRTPDNLLLRSDRHTYEYMRSEGHPVLFEYAGDHAPPKKIPRETLLWMGLSRWRELPDPNLRPRCMVQVVSIVH